MDEIYSFDDQHEVHSSATRWTKRMQYALGYEFDMVDLAVSHISVARSSKCLAWTRTRAIAVPPAYSYLH